MNGKRSNKQLNRSIIDCLFFLGIEPLHSLIGHESTSRQLELKTGRRHLINSKLEKNHQ
jgi:hypothetical protein